MLYTSPPVRAPLPVGDDGPPYYYPLWGLARVPAIAVSKTVVALASPWVRIPPPPPECGRVWFFAPRLLPTYGSDAVLMLYTPKAKPRQSCVQRGLDVHFPRHAADPGLAVPWDAVLAAASAIAGAFLLWPQGNTPAMACQLRLPNSSRASRHEDLPRLIKGETLQRQSRYLDHLMPAAPRGEHGPWGIAGHLGARIVHRHRQSRPTVGNLRL